LSVNKHFGPKVDARAPLCPLHRLALLFGTDGNGRLVEWCPSCGEERRVQYSAA
jgi:RNase P subunit RPR2